MELQDSKDAPRTPETRHANSVENASPYSQDALPLIPGSQHSFNPPPEARQNDSPTNVNGFNGCSENQREDDRFHSSSKTPKVPADALVAVPRHRGRPMLALRGLTLSELQQEILRTASALPPVTKASLKELDLPCIMNKLALRIDVNYDRDLHFTPARHERDSPRKVAAERYWEALAIELEIYTVIAPRDVEHDEPSGPFRPRLPGLFDTIREVLQTLVPTRDHPAIIEQLDTDLLLQQVRFKVLDMVALAKWLATLLKMHCAPMRDERADLMAMEIESGCLQNDMRKISSGLRLLFGVLETMKLVCSIGFCGSLL